MRRLVLAGLLAMNTAACGMPVRPLAGVALPPTPVRAASSQLKGAYLSVDLRPSEPLSLLARDLRLKLGFVDMSKAQPPRSPADFHVTVAYFHELSRPSAQKLAGLFQGRTAEIRVPGWGVCQNQAAYFAVTGVSHPREQIGATIPEHFKADDAHITFGVHPDKPKDVHGVPKPQLTAVTPLRVVGDIHLRQGDNVIW